MSGSQGLGVDFGMQELIRLSCCALGSLRALLRVLWDQSPAPRSALSPARVISFRLPLTLSAPHTGLLTVPKLMEHMCLEVFCRFAWDTLRPAAPPDISLPFSPDLVLIFVPSSSPQGLIQSPYLKLPPPSLHSCPHLPPCHTPRALPYFRNTFYHQTCRYIFLR